MLYFTMVKHLFEFKFKSPLQRLHKCPRVYAIMYDDHSMAETIC
jgi:hypothetical protein